MTMNRRSFLKTTGAAAVAGLAPASLWADAVGANERIRVGVMGVRGRGKSHVAALLAQKNVDIPYICDVDKNVVGPVVQMIEKAGGKTPTVVQDIRQVLEDKSVNAISIATTNHWHSLATFWACQAGKDVYVEKPISQTFVEGRRITEAARRYGRIVQHGTQNRSHPSVQAAIDFIRAGKLGKVTLTRAINFKKRGNIGKHTGTVPIPAGVDYDLWLGPAPNKPLGRNRLHYDWHWFWDYGSGDMGNQGVHQIDLARWALGKELPQSILSVGGRFGYDNDDGETANTQLVLFDYGDARLICEVRNLASKPVEGAFTGDVFYGTEGYIVRDLHKGNTCTAYMGKNKEAIKLGEAMGGDKLDQVHFANFLAAMRSRKHAELVADVEQGHYSSALCHLANISHRLGKETPFEPRYRAFEDKETTDLFQNMEEHLRDNKLKLEETKFSLGRKLTLDTKTENIIGDKEASALMTREYRKPFVMPEKV